MKIGVSSASLYPLHAALGVRCAELFANSTCEARDPVVGEIEQTCRQNGIEVLSFHPFSSPMESVYLFSTYDRRIEEMIQLYSEFFGTMKRLGAKIFVLHGAILSSKCPPEHYVKQFRLLAETGRKYGVTVAQENVSYCLSGDLEFLKMMKRELGGVDAVRTAQNAVKKAERPADKYAALNDLTTSVKAMYRQIKNIDMNEEDATYRESLMSNYNSDLDYLMRDDYNDKAAAFNDALHNSPAYALAKLVGIGDVELFA